MVGTSKAPQGSLQVTTRGPLKSKCSEFFKTMVHYLGFLVGTNTVQSLPEKAAAIEALEPSKDIEELRQFLGLVGF